MSIFRKSAEEGQISLKCDKE